MKPPSHCPRCAAPVIQDGGEAGASWRCVPCGAYGGKEASVVLLIAAAVSALLAALLLFFAISLIVRAPYESSFQLAGCAGIAGVALAMGCNWCVRTLMRDRRG